MLARKKREASKARVAEWKRDTPGCGNRIHLNNAGAALMPQPVFHRIEEHLRAELLQGGYEAAEERGEAIDNSYSALGRLINAAPRNIAVVENATVAVAQALSTIDFEPGDAIVTSQADYPSNQLMYLALAARRNAVVLRAEDLPDGGIDPDSVRALLRGSRCRLVSVSWVPTNSGMVQAVEAVARVCEEAGVPFLIDACQAVGQMSIDVSQLACDFLAATARKFLEARGASGSCMSPIGRFREGPIPSTSTCVVPNGYAPTSSASHPMLDASRTGSSPTLSCWVRARRPRTRSKRERQGSLALNISLLTYASASEEWKESASWTEAQCRALS